MATIKFDCLECSSPIYFDRSLWSEKEEWASPICPNCRRKYFLELRGQTKIATVLGYLFPQEIELDPEVVEEKLDNDRYPIKWGDELVKIYCGREKWDNELIGVANLTKGWLYQKTFNKLAKTIIFRRNIFPYILTCVSSFTLIYFAMYLGNSIISPNKKFDPFPLKSIAISSSLSAGYLLYRSERQKDRRKKLTGFKLKQAELSEVYRFQEKIEQLKIENEGLDEKCDRLKNNISRMRRISKNIYTTAIEGFQQKIQLLLELKKSNKQLIQEYKQLIKMIEIQSPLDILEQDEGNEEILIETNKEALNELEMRKQELILLAAPHKLIE